MRGTTNKHQCIDTVLWCLFILSEAETTPSEKGGIFVFTVV